MEGEQVAPAFPLGQRDGSITVAASTRRQQVPQPLDREVFRPTQWI
jgi:hypothetical protein